MTFGTDKRYDALIDAVEDIERRSLAVGDVDGSLDFDSIVDLAEPIFGPEAEDAVERLIDAALLHRVASPGGDERFRSRFAELMRLLVRIRQIFPNEAWQGAPPLVADFRVDLRKRRYPDRNRPSLEVLDRLAHLTARQRAVWTALAPDMIAGFQERAADLLLSPTASDRAAIVTAGTGSGKTLSFYLPVFTVLAEMIDETAWVKAIAIYPRNELLKDQLSETYRNAQRCAGAFNAGVGRPLRLGTFFGDTPHAAEDRYLSAWMTRGEDRLCPFLRCPCGGDMLWKRGDLLAKREVLTCARCSEVTQEDRIALTRASALRRPPDILFTTTEMLNRSLSDARRWTLFGLSGPRSRRPAFLLLDEVHTYAGVSGAQAALTLRRWRALHGGPVSWIGLSATLSEASQFFSDLTGAPLLATTEVSPIETEMVEEGREYQIVLRGDPVSQTSLLSTAIQSLMVLGRVMDPNASDPSGGRFGKRVFAFTDDLDVVQRLFDDFRDAEAYNAFGREDGSREPLAAMRAATAPGETPVERRARDQAGQRWSIADSIGRPVGRRLTISRTTSRDAGVDARSDAVVATSSLEVGFNDTTVGAVLQYKAPLNFASFLQRKGRAGRTRAMRPIMLTILSDYGRDRQLFQGYEHLFEPTLERQTLPIGNQYILRMQAAFSLLDWCARRLAGENAPAASMWRLASSPTDGGHDREQARRLADLVGRLARDDHGLAGELRTHLIASLGVNGDVVDRLLWQPPRSLLLEVVPTLLTRLYRNWTLAWPNPDRDREIFIKDHPLPEYVPRALFSELNLPDVELILPPHRQGTTETSEEMPIQQALGQFAPGRVSRRFGEDYGGLAHWYALPPGVQDVDLPVSDYAEVAEPLGEMTGLGPGGWITAPVFRPWRVRLQKAVPEVVKPTSNATPVWASGFTGLGAPVTIGAPGRTAWRDFAPQVEMYLQQHRASVGVRRFALGARAEIRRARGETQTVDVRYSQDGAPAAIGFAFETDGLAMHLSLPSDEELSNHNFSPATVRGLRTVRFKRLVAESVAFPFDCNVHERRWLAEVYLVGVALRAISRSNSLLDAADALETEGDPNFLDAAMDRLFGLQAGTGPATGASRLDRLRGTVRDWLTAPGIRQGLHAALHAAFDHGPEWGRFLRRTLDATLADALLAATITATPRHSATEALISDFEVRPETPGQTTIWLTETTVGGAGVLQSVAEPFASEPRRLFAALESVLEPGDLEASSEALVRVYDLLGQDAELATLVDAVRAEHGHVERLARRSLVLEHLARRGFDVGRSFTVSLSARLLSTNATRGVDALIRALLARWEALEELLGVELSARDAAALASDEASIRALADNAGLTANSTPLGERTNALAAVLWPKSSAIRRETLTAYNRYRPSVDIEPNLVRELLLDPTIQIVALENDDWEAQVVELLRQEASAQVWAPVGRPELLRTALVRMPAIPVTLGHLVLFATLERVGREPDRLTATFVLKEQL